MKVITELDRSPVPSGGTAVTIGAYDGVHRGHQQVIATVRQLAQDRGCASAVVTFDRHPATVVRPESAPQVLTDLEQKLELLAATGVDYTVVVAFDRERAREPAEDFVTEILSGCLRAQVVVVGEDFHFGRDRGGNVALLRDMGPALGFEVVGMPLVAAAPGEPVSSTAIRHALAAGDVVAAASLLGRPHEVRGVVRSEAGRGGALLGYPTANVAVPAEIQMPAEGIYAGWYVRPDGSRHGAAISFGRRPTFYDAAEPMLEAHLLDFSGDLYGEVARVQFVARLRAEERFDSPDALIAQMARDVQTTREVLAARSVE